MLVTQPNMQAQEELAALFSRNLTLDPLAPAQPVQTPAQEPKPVLISQHYTHSAHLIRSQDQQPQQPSRPASVPPQPEHLLVENILRNHGVDPSGLSSSQIQLFKTADEPQQLRLLELWRICPPTNNHDNPALAWGSTTIEQEEILAKSRYERQLAQQEAQEPVMSLDGTPLTPIQSGDGRWLVSMQNYMEPYMAAGYGASAYEEMARRDYEESARRAIQVEVSRPKDVYQHFGTAIGGGPEYNHATDPAYQTTNVGINWQQQQEMAMADQYGRMMQFRGGDDEML